MQSLHHTKFQCLLSGLEQEIFFKNSASFSLEDKVRFSMVCKEWRKLMERDEMRSTHFEELGLRERVGVPWITQCSQFLNSIPHMLAVDGSGSMDEPACDGSGLKNYDVAVTKACSIAIGLGPNLGYYGVDCFVFSDVTIWKRLYSIEEIEKFYIANWFQAGTDITALFRRIFNIQEINLKNKRLRTAQVSIISDFEDRYQLNALLEAHAKANIDFKCYLLPAATQNYASAFKNALETQLPVAEEAAQIQTRGKKRKRQQERKLELTFEVLGSKENLPRKKQKSEEKK